MFSLIFTLYSARIVKSAIQQVFFLLIISKSGLSAGIRWFVFISKSQRILCISFSRMDPGLCMYCIFIWSNYISCTIPSWSHFPPSPVYSYTLFAQVCCICLSYDLWFCLYDYYFFIIHSIKVCVTACILCSPGLFSVFWLIFMGYLMPKLSLQKNTSGTI